MSELADLGGWPSVLRVLIAGDDLSPDQATAALADILDGAATSAQTAGFIVGLRQKGETVSELTALLRSMMAASERVTLPVRPP